MNTEDEALKLALEALRLYQRTLAPADTQCKGVAAVAAIEQALAVQQQCKWPTCQSEEYQQALAEQINQELVTGAAQPLHALRSAIADDALAISFQSLGQYRSALLKLIDAEQAAQPAPVPLTDTEFEALHWKAKGYVATGLMDVVRIVETHHGITTPAKG